MKHNSFLVGAGICLVTAVAICYATMGGQQYSVSIHFVPPLVTGACSIAQFWTPPNITCAWCFCITGTLSRCIPQPGCTPANGTTTTTAAPGPSTGSNVAPTAVTGTVTPGPSTPPSAAVANSTAAPQPQPQPGPPSETATSPPAVVANLIRKRRGVRKTKAKF